MASLNMLGPFNLTTPEIDNQVRTTSSGNYALGHLKDNTFMVMYVGRSDTDLNSRLKDHVGEHPLFKYSYAGTPKDAFEKECKNFHEFGGSEKLKNTNHPDRPDGSELECPHCPPVEE